MILQKTNSGQSLVEVVVAIGMMSLLLISLLALISLSIKNSRLAKTRAQAVALAQEGMELMRTYRDYNWQALLTSNNRNFYNLPETWTVDNGLTQFCPEEFEIGNGVFNRCVQVVAIDTETVELTVKVKWREGGQEQQTVQQGQLTLWER